MLHCEIPHPTHQEAQKKEEGKGRERVQLQGRSESAAVTAGGECSTKVMAGSTHISRLLSTEAEAAAVAATDAISNLP